MWHIVTWGIQGPRSRGLRWLLGLLGCCQGTFFELILYGNPVIYHVPVFWQHNLNSLTATQVKSNLACLAYNLICSLLAGFQGVVAVCVTFYKFSRGSQNTYKVPCGFAERGVVTSQMSRRSSFPQSLSELFPPALLSFLRALTCQHIGKFRNTSSSECQYFNLSCFGP